MFTYTVNNAARIKMNTKIILTLLTGVAVMGRCQTCTTRQTTIDNESDHSGIFIPIVKKSR